MSNGIIKQAQSLEGLGDLMREYLQAKARYLAGVRFGIGPERFTCCPVDSGEDYVTIDGQIHVEANLDNDELEFCSLDFQDRFKPKDWLDLFVSLYE